MATKIDRNECVEVRHDGYHWPEFIYAPLANIIDIYYDANCDCECTCCDECCQHDQIEIKYRVPPFGPLRQRHDLDGDGKPFVHDMRPIRTGLASRRDLRTAGELVAARKAREKVTRH